MKLVVGSICLLFSIVLFPLFALGSLTLLFLIALSIESLHSLTGAAKRMDESASRTLAMRIRH
jgi:hypothetical protein